MTSDLFAERFAAVRERFIAKLGARIEEIETQIKACVPESGQVRAMEMLALAHRRAHDLCGVGPTMGFVATGKAARSIEQILLAALKAERGLTGQEIAQVTEGIAHLRSAANAETQPAALEQRA